jgi:hypothetical protein
MRRYCPIYLLAVALALSAYAPAHGQASKDAPTTQKKSSAKKQGVRTPVTSDTVDPNMFEPQNQKQCDYPSACGCNCTTTPPRPKAPTR